MKLKKIIKYIERKYNKCLAYEGDPVGLYFANKSKKIERVLVNLDLTMEVIEEAIAKKIDLIIVHHPFTYIGNSEVVAYNAKKKIMCIDNDIAVYVLHTNYDIAYGGMNDILAKHIGLSDIGIIEESTIEYQFMRKGKIKEQSLYQFADYLKELFNVKSVRIIGKDKKIDSVCILGGNGSDSKSMLDAKNENCSVYVTGDLNYESGLFAYEKDVTIIEVPHSIEKVFIDDVVNFLNELDVELFKSEIDTDPFEIY